MCTTPTLCRHISTDATILCFRPKQTEQSTSRLSARGIERSPRVRRARLEGLQASAHERLGESRGGDEQGPFQRQLESPSIAPGEGLTAHDILEAHRMFEEGGGGFEGGEDAEERPLRGAELGMDQHIDRQVMFSSLIYRTAMGYACFTLLIRQRINVLAWFVSSNTPP